MGCMGEISSQLFFSSSFLAEGVVEEAEIWEAAKVESFPSLLYQQQPEWLAEKLLWATGTCLQFLCWTAHVE